jgi:FlaA1/EpsC-like NDP-sugar epimerase
LLPPAEIAEAPAPTLQEVLLGRRERAVLTAADRRALAGQSVLVTGAGGSVGSELVRLMADCRPSRLVAFEQSEYNLFRLEREVRAAFPSLPFEPFLGDVTRVADVEQAMRLFHPHVVYHAAAYKHVTMAERAVLGAIRTNVFGTRVVARSTEEHGARLVLVSTDKAAQPSSVMGATKRFAELVALESAAAGRVTAVRFGNILGSSGSLLELMLERLRDGLPIELTDRDATRYFMTPREAVSLIAKADLLGQNREIYWLDMGEPVRIVDLAERLLDWGESAGFSRVPVRFVGLRPGEKLREELTTQGLELRRTRHRRIWMARQSMPDHEATRRVLKALAADLKRGDALTALADLCAAVPEYSPSREARRDAMASALTLRPAPGRLSVGRRPRPAA